jgi:hypothetical protein
VITPQDDLCGTVGADLEDSSVLEPRKQGGGDDDEDDYDDDADSIDIRHNLLQKILTQGSSTVSGLNEFREADEKAAYERYASVGSAMSAINLLEKVEKLQKKSSIIRTETKLTALAGGSSGRHNTNMSTNLDPKTVTYTPARTPTADGSDTVMTSTTLAPETDEVGKISTRTLQSVWRSCSPTNCPLILDGAQVPLPGRNAELHVLLRDQLTKSLEPYLASARSSTGRKELTTRTRHRQHGASSAILRSSLKARMHPAQDIAHQLSFQLLNKASQYDTKEQSTSTTKIVTKDAEMSTVDNIEEIEEQLQEVGKLTLIPQNVSVDFDFSDVDSKLAAQLQLQRSQRGMGLVSIDEISQSLRFSELLGRTHIHPAEFRRLNLRSSNELKPSKYKL